MICPNCATRNELGSERCINCGTAFTYEARMSEAPEEYYEPASQYGTPANIHAGNRGRRGLNPLVAIVAIVGLVAVAAVILVLIASNLVIKPMVRDEAVDRIHAGMRDEIRSELDQRLAGAPAGTVVVTEEDLNERIANNDRLGPIRDARIQIQQDQVNVNISAYGVSGSYTTSVRADNGTVVLEDGQVSGLLRLVIPSDAIVNELNAEIAAALAASGYYVESLEMQDGSITLTVAR